MMRILLLLLALAAATFAQQPADQKPSEAPGLGIEVGQKPEPASPTKAPQSAPDRKMTPAEKEELFRAVDEMLTFASNVTGLPQKSPVKRELATRDEVEKFIQQNLKEDEDTKRLERSELVLKKFGLLPRDFDLRSFIVSLLKEQVAGYYDPKRKALFVLDWLEPEAQRPVMVHELTHAIQDQNFNIQKFAKAGPTRPYLRVFLRLIMRNPDNDIEVDERTSARHAVVEGQAMVVLFEYMLKPMGASINSAPQLVDAMINEMAKSPETPQLAAAPMYLRESLLFPYSNGLRFVATTMRRSRERAFKGLFKNPPRDTFDVMFPERFLKGEKLMAFLPPKLDRVLGSDWKRYDRGVIGAFDQQVILKQFDSKGSADALVPHYRGAWYWAAAPKAAVPQPANLALVFASRWATADAAAQFAAAYAKSVEKRYSGAEKAVGAATLAQAGVPKVQVEVTPRASGPMTWKTSEGLVSIEARGDTVLVIEGLPDEARAKVSKKVFGDK